MARKKGSQNKIQTPQPDICDLSSEARVELLANLIIDSIQADQLGDQTLLKRIDSEVVHEDRAYKTA